ncbi:MAG: phosphotransferase family protein [Myxococcota bacterium]|jgi:aminoglycoside phosphotransferase (APT) family kinase protein|nr:phosphotransferase family protein [Deltaproteobacteria bacterium]MCP4244813.1 phosphotransferase family protein [bacterium]MDP6074200.1 phosphotransferase family protein [Myxococcota bacterium]MDP6243066.1 phosphotransferase family protein [Myxococcota bacterium]MDP7075796.1 phosphotransferase family protein [Myxococcota bacterium]
MSEPASEEMKRSTRDRGALRGRLRDWLVGTLPGASGVEVSEISSPSATGMSSETLLFDARWQEAGQRRGGSFVARLQPDPADTPVFPVYDMEVQFRTLRLVAERSKVPVPAARWLELDPEALGAAFFVMDRVEGRVPPDVMPYTFDSWLSQAARAEQRHLQDATVAVLAELHAIDPAAVDAAFLEFDLPGDSPLRRHVENQRRYYEWARADRRHPVIERAFAWLEQHWPDEEGAAVVSWGDSRIGNILFDGFAPAAVLDWEMAALGPRELDLGWLCFMHLFFDDIARQTGLPGMPHFLRPEDVAATYAERTGRAPGDLRFYDVYAGLRHAIIMTRVSARRIHFGEAEWPEDVDEVIPHRAVLERMLEGEDPRPAA